MAKKVKALTSMYGQYGQATAGDILELRNSSAEQLAAKNMVEILEPTDSIENTAFVEKNLTTGQNVKKVRGSIQLSHVKSEGGASHSGETDKYNAAGPDKPDTNKIKI